MPNYAGEVVEIIHTATKDKEPLVPEEITAVWVSIYNSARAVFVAESLMTWDAVHKRWQYVWNTDGVAPGTYRLRVRIEGVDGGSVWEFAVLRLARNPVPV